MKTRQIEAGAFSWLVREWGDPSDRAVLFLHGFTWTSDAWHAIAEGLSAQFRCIAVDLPGHGGTAWPEALPPPTFEKVSHALLELLGELKSPPPHLVGYSLGGRLALRMATLDASKFERLALIGASAGLETEQERSERRRSDEVLASAIETDGLPAFVDAWSNLKLFSGMRRLSPEIQAQHRVARLSQDPQGLSTCLRVLGVGSQPYLLDALGDLELPTLLVVGEHDEKFRGIAEHLQRRLPHAMVETVPDSGHCVPFERPEALIESLNAFLQPRLPFH